MNAHDVWRDGKLLFAVRSGRISCMLCLSASVMAALTATAPAADTMISDALRFGAMVSGVVA